MFAVPCRLCGVGLMNSSLLATLAKYVRVLSDASDQTTHSEDRPKYQAHLAAAARMFVAAFEASTSDELRRLVDSERHSFGWAYLSGDPGERAEEAFNEFAMLVENGRFE